MKKLISFFAFCFLLLGVQESSFAQLRVFNGTSCTLYVYAGETAPLCNTCNVTATVPVLPGQSIQFTSTCTFPEYWKGIGFSTSPTGPGWGYTYNPTIPLGYTCSSVPNVSGLCGGTAINGTMLGAGGFGPQTIVIF